MTARRSLSTTARLRIFENRGGVCHLCEQKIQVGEKWEVEHRIPLAMGGADDETNMFPAHRKCHAVKSKADAGKLAKVTRIRAKHRGAWKRTGRPVDGSVRSGWKIKMDRTVERR
jgi:5-methylcytosine-specific restriction protein A